MKTIKIIKFIIIGLLAVTVFGLVIMLLWNWLIPDLFGLREITFFESLGLLLLSKIFFWGFGGKGHGSRWDHRRRFQQKRAGMSPEEREAFKEKMWAKWCRQPNKPEDAPKSNSND